MDRAYIQYCWIHLYILQPCIMHQYYSLSTVYLSYFIKNSVSCLLALNVYFNARTFIFRKIFLLSTSWWISFRQLEYNRMLVGFTYTYILVLYAVYMNLNNKNTGQNEIIRVSTPFKTKAPISIFFLTEAH